MEKFKFEGGLSQRIVAPKGFVEDDMLDYSRCGNKDILELINSAVRSLNKGGWALTNKAGNIKHTGVSTGDTFIDITESDEFEDVVVTVYEVKKRWTKEIEK